MGNQATDFICFTASKRSALPSIKANYRFSSIPAIRLNQFVLAASSKPIEDMCIGGTWGEVERVELN